MWAARGGGWHGNEASDREGWMDVLRTAKA